MEKLLKDSDTRISNIVTIMDNFKSQVEDNRVSSRTSTIKPPRDEKTKAILRLVDEGWTVVEIAKSVNLSEAEVEMVIQMNK